MVESKILSELMNSSKKGVESFKKLTLDKQVKFIFRLPLPLQKKLLEGLDDLDLINLINKIDSDDGTDLLQKISERRRKKIIRKLNTEKKKKIDFLLKFNPETAAGLMDLDYILINSNMTFEKISKKIKIHEKRTGKIPTTLVVENGVLIGELKVHVLALHPAKEKIKKYIVKVPSIKYNQKEDEVLKIFKKNPNNKIIVTDDDDSVLGIIYSEDILKLIGKKSLSSLTDFAGVSEKEDILDSVFLKVKHRYSWLLIHLFTGFLAAIVVSFFQDAITALILLAVYMPIVAGMGGNAGTQSMAVIIRGMVLREINSKVARKVLINETLAGGINGIINGVIVALVAIFWNKSPVLGFVVGLAMIINLALAGFFGTIVPIIMQKLNKDPASSAITFITAATDIFGFFIFLGLATLVI